MLDSRRSVLSSALPKPSLTATVDAVRSAPLDAVAGGNTASGRIRGSEIAGRIAHRKGCKARRAYVLGVYHFHKAVRGVLGRALLGCNAGAPPAIPVVLTSYQHAPAGTRIVCAVRAGGAPPAGIYGRHLGTCRRIPAAVVRGCSLARMEERGISVGEAHREGGVAILVYTAIGEPDGSAIGRGLGDTLRRLVPVPRHLRSIVLTPGQVARTASAESGNYPVAPPSWIGYRGRWRCGWSASRLSRGRAVCRGSGCGSPRRLLRLALTRGAHP